MSEHTWWVVGALALLVVLAVLLDPWLAPQDPTAAERRAWYAKRLAHRRGAHPDEAQMSRWLEEDR
jgi:hypothetical protein